MIIFLICNGNFAETSAGLAAENMFLAAKSLGVNSCWVEFGKFALKDEALSQKLGITKADKCIAPLIFGYADGEPEIPAKRELDVRWL